MDLREIAEIEGLQYFETTSERNGYPANIKGAIKGFDNFEQAESLAKKYNLEIEEFTKKEGWKLWFRTNNRASEPFIISNENYGDDYSMFRYNQFADEKEFFKEEVKPLLSDFDDFEELQDFIESRTNLWERIEELEEGELIITYLGGYHEAIKSRVMEFYQDTRYSVIGVLECENN